MIYDQSTKLLDTTRPLDPNVLQRRAAEPDSSVWVNASAGTGKTKVLTDRVLRLLMPRQNGDIGTLPHKILCLTFTKAAAAEMALRISETLSHWAVMEEADLTEALTNLFGYAPKDTDLSAARRLFAETVDTPGGLKIMTLHAFCQSVLARFPLEAGITPSFTALDEVGAAEVMHKARDTTIKIAETQPSSPLYNALQNLAENLNAEQFMALISNMASERNQLTQILQFGADGHYAKICQHLDLRPDQSADDLILEACSDASCKATKLRSICELLINSTGKKDQTRGDILAHFLSLNQRERVGYFDDYLSVYLKKDGDFLKSLMVKKLADAHPDALESLKEEGVRIQAIFNKIKAAKCAILTRDLLLIGEDILQHYAALKAEKSALDFDDMIVSTLHLLQGKTTGLSAESAASWVLYKLDQGIDHILIDEAQDTNPEQWKVIESLCGDFFQGENAHEQSRSVFVVGDDKQSIYSFQRASPEEFARMRSFFEDKVKISGQNWAQISLNISFRSTQAILDTVDAVFAPEIMHKGVGNVPTDHKSFRQGQAGMVELWALCEAEAQENTNTEETPDPWEPPIQIREAKGGSSILATEIAQKIRNWLDSGEILPAHNRPIEAGDIMVLVRSRKAFVTELSRALKNLNIPVSGADRMKLSEQIAVQDVLAAASFTLLPTDDLNLACLLKSPLIGMSEQTLYDIAQPRAHGTSLWQALKDTPNHTAITNYLSNLINLAKHNRPYDVLGAILQRPCPADNISGLRAMKKRLGIDALDPLEELLNTALNFERDHTPSLQQFLHWQAQGEGEIKREMDKGGGEVRIMTIHASKGLQAPIVILPDTTRTTRNPGTRADDRLLWPDKTGQDILLYTPRKEEAYSEYTTIYNTLQARADDEYRRLLYVAMTRAEDRLYICGAVGSRKPLEDSWYNFVKSGLESMDHVETLEDGSLRLKGIQSKSPDRERKAQKSAPEQKHNLPQWLHHSAPTEPTPKRPLTPSRPTAPDAPASSPLRDAHNYRFTRGNLTHKLLEILPSLPKDTRENTALSFLSTYGQELNEDIRNSIVAETLTILNHPQFKVIFGTGSMAETPITGLMPDGRVISGQIDRLLVTKDTIWIIDYKTNRPPPKSADDVPLIYRNQMQSYADVLRKIYPDRTLFAALLWTDGPNLMPIDID